MVVKKKKIALVTGASSALGKYITAFLTTKGYEVIKHYYTTKPEEQLSNFSDLVLPLNFCDLTQLEEHVTDYFKVHQPIDLLINNAAIFNKDSPTNFTAKSLNTALSVNSVAPTILTQALYNYQSNKFTVINILDYAVFSCPINFFSYNLSKKLLAEATLMQAAAYADKARINGIALGPLIKGKNQSIQHFDEIAMRNPFKTQVKLQDVLTTIAFFINTTSITGQIIALDNGKHLYIDPYN